MAANNRMVQTLVAPTMNAGANFLSGAVTSTFQVVGSLAINPLNEISKIEGQALQVLEMAKNGVFNLSQNVAGLAASATGGVIGTVTTLTAAISNLSDIGMTIVQDVQNYSMQKIQDAMQKVTPDPDRVSYWTLAYTTYFSDKKLKEYMEEDEQYAEYLTKKQSEQNKAKSLTDYLDVANKAIADAGVFLNKIQQKVEKFMKKIQSYILAGQQEIQKWINKNLEVVYDSIDKFYEEKVDKKIKDAKEEVSRKIGRSMGLAAGNTIAWTKYKIIYKGKMLAKRMIEKVKLLAKRMIHAAKLQIVKLTGNQMIDLE